MQRRATVFMLLKATAHWLALEAEENARPRSTRRWRACSTAFPA
jgi:hypothetical protein